MAGTKKKVKGGIYVSAYNRYSFTKEVYPDYVVLLVRKNKYYSYGNDRKLLEYIKFN